MRALRLIAAAVTLAAVSVIGAGSAQAAPSSQQIVFKADDWTW
ncbi:hypothetical protein BCF74_103152 [Knoellia remsis]|uniref:ABC transporter substrate-binding protein n=1 Tax=Knoellia remsis TaxID=407159 RepID=A0A2T0UYI5_9MICO|nr:hypothetical protein [Knoellia remsis]PRY62944.1 hypothetical protein BCF74_103152 [Knoellia remsis]